jgi:hypothetical protein
VVYGLSEELRGMRSDPSPNERRRAAHEAAFENSFPETHGLSAIGLGWSAGGDG